jgi:hypothetical protein
MTIDHWGPSYGYFTNFPLLLLLWLKTQRDDYRRAALADNMFVLRTISLDGPLIQGDVKGLFPIDGGYGPWKYLSSACQFTIDANHAEFSLG